MPTWRLPRIAVRYGLRRGTHVHADDAPQFTL